MPTLDYPRRAKVQAVCTPTLLGCGGLLGRVEASLIIIDFIWNLNDLVRIWGLGSDFMFRFQGQVLGLGFRVAWG